MRKTRRKFLSKERSVMCMLSQYFAISALALLLLVSAPNYSYAANIKGSIGARILDITTMDIREAKKLCKEQPDIVKCEVLKEKKDLFQSIEGLPEDAKIYDVLTANFE